MLPIPAIDVLDGQVVRLLRGDYDSVTEYSDDPVAVAARYVGAGAARIHVVDLGAARDGGTDLELVRRLAALVPELQVGGGIRDAATAIEVLRAGASRVVVGSLAVHDPDALIGLTTAVGGDRVVVAVDVRDGRARGTGWLDAGTAVEVVVERAVASGARSMLVTGIDRDGTMQGPDLGLLRDVRFWAPDVELIASGGISSLDDLDAAASAGADAAVVGRALLEGAFTAEELMSRSR